MLSFIMHMHNLVIQKLGLKHPSCQFILFNIRTLIDHQNLRICSGNKLVFVAICLYSMCFISSKWNRAAANYDTTAAKFSICIFLALKQHIAHICNVIFFSFMVWCTSQIVYGWLDFITIHIIIHKKYYSRHGIRM